MVLAHCGIVSSCWLVLIAGVDSPLPPPPWELKVQEMSYVAISIFRMFWWNLPPHPYRDWCLCALPPTFHKLPLHHTKRCTGQTIVTQSPLQSPLFPWLSVVAAVNCQVCQALCWFFKASETREGRKCCGDVDWIVIAWGWAEKKPKWPSRWWPVELGNQLWQPHRKIGDWTV